MKPEIKVVGLGIICVCFLIRAASRYHFTFTTEYIHNVLKTFLPLVTRPCRFDQITRGKIKPRTEGFINHVLMAAILIFTQPRRQCLLVKLESEKTLGERLRSAKTRREWGPKLDECGHGWRVFLFLFVCLFSDQFLTGMRYQEKL